MIVIESVRLENIEFSANYLHSIEQRVLPEVEVQKLQQNAERETVQAQITVTQATAKANAVRAEPQANADATRLNGEARAANIKITGEAEAAAIEARAKALGTNPNLVTLETAFDAFRRFGKGQGHPAQLNIADCAVYALAKARSQPSSSRVATSTGRTFTPPSVDGREWLPGSNGRFLRPDGKGPTPDAGSDATSGGNTPAFVQTEGRRSIGRQTTYRR